MFMAVSCWPDAARPGSLRQQKIPKNNPEAPEKPLASLTCGVSQGATPHA
jgi:hypothetical protein